MTSEAPNQPQLIERLGRTQTAARNNSAATRTEQGNIWVTSPAFSDKQGWIAATVSWLYVVIISAVAIACLVSPLFPFDDNLQERAKGVRDLANTLVLPIVTLMLGFYFGERHRN